MLKKKPWDDYCGHTFPLVCHCILGISVPRFIKLPSLSFMEGSVAICCDTDCESMTEHLTKGLTLPRNDMQNNKLGVRKTIEILMACMNNVGKTKYTTRIVCPILVFNTNLLIFHRYLSFYFRSTCFHQLPYFLHRYFQLVDTKTQVSRFRSVLA